MMAALVQTLPQSTSTVTMLQTRPSSSGALQSGSQSQRVSGGRNSYTAGGNIFQYRGHTSPGLVAPYAFTATPPLASNQNPLRQHPLESLSLGQSRSNSAPGGVMSAPNGNSSQPRLSPSAKFMDQSDSYFKTDSPRLSLLNTSLDLSLSDPRINANNPAKPSPDRYRRAHKRSETASPTFPAQLNAGSAMPSGSGMATVGHLYNLPSQSLSSPSFTTTITGPGTSKDDSAINRSSDALKRYRRRSINTIKSDDAPSANTEARPKPATQMRSYASVVSTPYNPQKQEATIPSMQPISLNVQNNSNESLASSKSSRPSSSKREGANMVSSTPAPTVVQGTSIPKHEAKLVNIPPRGSSDAAKRIANPSPLSKPISLSSEQPASQSSFAKLVQSKNTESEQQISQNSKPTDSPAAQQLAALSKKDGKKEGKSSRLRRAFSFGSAAELRKASAENSHAANKEGRNKLQKEQYQTEEEAREAAIVQQQEASGLGNSIYSGQGNIFTGSTDNISVSSTASSASIMLRKMGKGVKKSTRSLVGLFRPKSVIGVPAADATVPEPSIAQVSMVTVEAEREKVNVNLDPHDQAGGGTGFPKLERNSLDAASLSIREPSLTTSDRSSDNIKSRRSIVGGEKERAEVLAAVKKGILKRNGTDSGTSSPIRSAEIRSPDFTLPQLPRFNESPRSSAPNTPNDENTPRGHRRTDSVTIEGEDYFMSIGRFSSSEAKSLPGTPKSISRNISFSPRIQFHDTWTSTDYDRRGEIATCNRLTPTLAQAIKEELNTFKMEMEVHESSKVYTHFF